MQQSVSLPKQAAPQTGGDESVAWLRVTPSIALHLACLALLTFGEGWHNNHHRHAVGARLGFYWWQLDLGWLGLELLAKLGLVCNLKTPPEPVLEEGARCAWPS